MGIIRVPAAEVYWMTKLTGREPLAFCAFLIEGEGYCTLVNTGFAHDVSKPSRWLHVGDIVTIKEEKMGELKNSVVEKPLENPEAT